NDPNNILAGSGPIATDDKFIQFAWQAEVAAAADGTGGNDSSKPTISLVDNVAGTAVNGTGDGTSAMKFTKQS
ncbi:MAG: hypothetical protein IJQ25_09855, partial [Oscillibacter sp.]|nr:hypothetical protein [Oscillibacter sp.]